MFAAQSKMEYFRFENYFFLRAKIILAAHCFEKQLLQMYQEIQRIFYGRSSLTGQEASGQAVFVSEVISHENFDIAFRNDIALLRHQES